MTAIDLTRDQCAALANFLRRTVGRGMDSGYDEIELLVLAQRALRNAAKPAVHVPLCDVPESGTPEGGGTVSAAREAAPARPSGASEAALCGGEVNADKLTRMCDREKFPIETWRQVAAALDKLEGGNEDGRQSE